MSIRDNNNWKIEVFKEGNYIKHRTETDNLVSLASWDKIQLINLIYSVLLDNESVTISDHGKTIQFKDSKAIRMKKIKEADIKEHKRKEYYKNEYFKNKSK